jgi:hypothetical protein
MPIPGQKRILPRIGVIHRGSHIRPVAAEIPRVRRNIGPYYMVERAGRGNLVEVECVHRFCNKEMPGEFLVASDEFNDLAALDVDMLDVG